MTCWMLHSRLVALALSLTALVGLSAPAAAGNRVALIIGNGAYAAAPVLVQPIDDSADLAGAFGRIGFEVTRLNDLDGRAMRRALREFEAKAAGASVAVIYFSGHGIAVDGVNYLLPVDARLERDSHVDDEGIPLSRLINSVDDAADLRLVMLDAARDNPRIAVMLRSAGKHAVARGLVRIAPVGSTVVFSARDGAIAERNDRRNGAFAAALIARLNTPDSGLETFLGQVHDDVVAATDGRQESIVVGPTSAPVPMVPDAEMIAMLSRPPPPLAERLSNEKIIELFRGAETIGSIEAWDAFLQFCSAGEIDNPYCVAAMATRRKLVESGAGSGGQAHFFDDGSRAGADDPPGALEVVISGERAAARCDRLAAHALDGDRPSAVAGTALAALGAVADVAIAACTKAVDAAPGERRYAFELGRALHAAGRADEASAWYDRAAEAGSVAAMVNLAALHRDGNGVARDPAVARKWFRDAVAGGSVAAMNGLGLLDQDGAGGPADLEGARALFEQAAAAGDPAGMVNLGRLYNYGRGVAADHPRARALYEQAAALGNSDAMLSLGLMAENDQGGSWAFLAVSDWYGRAASRDNAAAMTRLGILYQDGRWVDVDLAEAARWFDRAAALGDPAAMARIGGMHDTGYGAPVDKAAARVWYGKAAAAGHGPSMALLGLLFANGDGGPIDYDAALAWYRRGATIANAAAMADLGFMYEYGWGVEKSYPQALEWYLRGAAAGNAIAMSNAALLYENGRGIDENLAEAFRWYGRSAEAGNTQAMASLGYFYANGMGTEIDNAVAFDWYIKAADLGNAIAMHNLGVAYKDGLGTAQDLGRAAELFIQSLEAGNGWTFDQFRDSPDNYPAEVLTAIERYLVDNGYLAGEPDGEVDADTRAALTALQAAVGG